MAAFDMTFVALDIAGVAQDMACVAFNMACVAVYTACVAHDVTCIAFDMACVAFDCSWHGMRYSCRGMRCSWHGICWSSNWLTRNAFINIFNLILWSSIVYVWILHIVYEHCFSFTTLVQIVHCVHIIDALKWIFEYPCWVVTQGSVCL